MHDLSQKLVDDMKAIADDTRELISLTAENSAAGVASARDKARSTLAALQARIVAAEEAAVQRTRAAARATDEYVHDSPWIAMVAAALVGAIVGILLTRR